MEAKFIQNAITLILLAFLVLCIVIMPLREWLFGRPNVDDRQGFPWSRGKHR
jgi:hypothetical protein